MGDPAAFVRRLSSQDREAWSALRHALWPDQPVGAHSVEVDEILATGSASGFGAFAADGPLVAFAEVSIRPYANGCTSTPVPFLEGIFVKDGRRRHGVAGLLIGHIEKELQAQGFMELCSDAEIHNTVSLAAHRHWGFAETERVVYFRKPLMT